MASDPLTERPETEQNPGRLGWLALIGYGLPAVPLSALLLPLYAYLPAFYAQEMGLGFAAVGGILAAARIWDGITDPVAGWLSDRTRNRWGRRKPWIAAGMPLLALSLYMLFLPPPGSGGVHLALWSFALYLGATMMVLPHNALGAELSSDYHERSRIAGTREALGALGALGILALPPLLGVTGAAAMAAIGIALLIALPLLVAPLLAFVQEPPDAVRPAASLGEGLAALRRNGPFQRLLSAYLLNGIANGMPATLFFVYAERVLQRADLAGALLFAYFVAGIGGVPIWFWLSRRTSKHRAWFVSMMVSAVVFAFVPLLGAGDIVPFLIVTVLTGLCLGGDFALPPSMQADVIDLDTQMTGERRAGLFFALWNVATKAALVIAVAVSFPLLSALGFDGGSPVPGQALLALSLLYAGLPAALKVAAAFIVRGYWLDAAALARVQRA